MSITFELRDHDSAVAVSLPVNNSSLRSFCGSSSPCVHDTRLVTESQLIAAAQLFFACLVDLWEELKRMALSLFCSPMAGSVAVQVEGKLSDEVLSDMYSTTVNQQLR